MKESYRFFQNTSCTYFPCHKGIDKTTFNCLFCYCPLYMLKENCGGNYTYQNGVKNCVNCLFPHSLGGYDGINKKLREYINKEKRERMDR